MTDIFNLITRQTIRTAAVFFFICSHTTSMHAQKTDHGLSFILSENEVEGVMLFYDEEERDYVSNSRIKSRRSKPTGSTFDIFNALMFYHLQVVSEETDSLEWDEVVRTFDEVPVTAWNKNTTLKEAFYSSNSYYFETLSADIPMKMYRTMLRKSKFVNSSGYKKKRPDFWNSSSKYKIKLTDFVKFLRRLKNEDLPFNLTTIRNVHNLMLEEESESYQLYGKVGLANNNHCFVCNRATLGWYVGYVITDNNTYYFASYIEKEIDEDVDDFLVKRRRVVIKSLKHLYGIDLKM